jgi:hypothetical protein
VKSNRHSCLDLTGDALQHEQNRSWLHVMLQNTDLMLWIVCRTGKQIVAVQASVGIRVSAASTLLLHKEQDIC